jgi:hypothetical protein
MAEPSRRARLGVAVEADEQREPLADGPLQALRVIKFGQLIAGPYVGTLLADFGADVIKIEAPPHGDALREWGRHRHNGHSLLAEKVATMMSRRELNSRDRDFADVWVLSRSLDISARVLRAAIDDVAAHRHHDVVALADALANMPDRQGSYSAMLRRLAYQRTPPERWADLLADVSEFVDTLIADTRRELTTWDAVAARWRVD